MGKHLVKKGTRAEARALLGTNALEGQDLEDIDWQVLRGLGLLPPHPAPGEAFGIAPSSPQSESGPSGRRLVIETKPITPISPPQTAYPLQSSEDSAQDGDLRRIMREKQPSPLDMDFEIAVDGPRELQSMLAQYVPIVTDEAVARVQAIVENARANPPSDPKAFVRDVNRLLELLDLRLRVDGEVLGKLRVVPGANEREYIQFAVTKTRGGRPGGTRGGFQRKGVRVEVVRVPREYARVTNSPSI